MQIILLEDVKSVGKKGQVVKVSDGYARNMILPKNLGIEATPKNMNDLKLKQKHEEKIAQNSFAEAQKLAEEIALKQIEIKVKAGESGKIFGTVSSKEIATAAKAQLNLELDKKKIQLPDGLKTLGEHEVSIKLHSKVVAQLKVKVIEK
ncbi:50S ribosomal protein L9 [Lachnospiraceae bacterium ZAX-1]